MKMKSKEEEYFLALLEELKAKKHIIKFLYEPETFLLSKGVKVGRRVVIPKIEYTTDFKVWINPKSPLFTEKLPSDNQFVAVNNIAYFEVKGIKDHHNMTRLVRPLIAWVYEKYKTPINLVKVPTSGKEGGVFEAYCPEVFIKDLVYKRNTKNYKIGESKIKFKYNIVPKL